MDWTRGRTIGRGSSATVSIATVDGSGEIFAVKSAELSKSESLQKEQKIFASLESSPKIISYKGFNVSSENGELMYNLCLEFAPGGSLSEQVSRRGGRLSQAEIRGYTRQILIGLDHLHSAGIVHCDVKGRNILVTGEGLKIADLGCARFSDDVAGGDWVPIAGTPAYMAPEVARGEQQGFAADVWALGCTVIEMATGRAPWADVFDPVSAFYRVGFSDDVPEVPGFLSKEGEDFLGKCLKRDPLERWSVSELLNHPFLVGSEPEPDCVVDEFEFDGFGLDSPRCVLDYEKDPNPGRESVTESPAERIRRLSGGNGVSFWEMDDWASDEDWVTIRSNCTQDKPDKLSLGPSSNWFEPTNMIGIENFWMSLGDDLASPTKFSCGLENCEVRSSSSDWGGGRSSYNREWGRFREWKRGSLKSFKCTKDELIDYLKFEIDLRFFMHCPVPFSCRQQSTSFSTLEVQNLRYLVIKEKIVET